jgi:F-type H+-transporting ATPase subunit b
MHFDPWTFGLQAANFLVLVWLLHRFLYRPVLGVIAARQAAAAKLTADLDAQTKAAKVLRDDLEAQAAAIARERDSALAAARAAADAERKILLAQAHRDADAERAAAQTSFDRERAELVGSTGRDAARLAVSIVGRLLKEPPAATAQNAMLELVCEDVERLPDEAKQHICERIADDDHAPEVVTASVLDEKAQTHFAARLAKSLGAPVHTRFRTDPDLLAGVEVRFASTILRRAWSEDLRRIEAELIHDDGAQKFA